jgi:hypothetical protein
MLIIGVQPRGVALGARTPSSPSRPTTQTEALSCCSGSTNPATRLRLARSSFDGHGGAGKVGGDIWQVLSTDLEALIRIGYLKELEGTPARTGKPIVPSKGDLPAQEALKPGKGTSLVITMRAHMNGEDLFATFASFVDAKYEPVDDARYNSAEGPTVLTVPAFRHFPSRPTLALDRVSRQVLHGPGNNQAMPPRALGEKGPRP